MLLWPCRSLGYFVFIASLLLVTRQQQLQAAREKKAEKRLDDVERNNEELLDRQAKAARAKQLREQALLAAGGNKSNRLLRGAAVKGSIPLLPDQDNSPRVSANLLLCCFSQIDLQSVRGLCHDACL